MKTYKLTLSDATLKLVAQYVAGLALIDEDKAADLLDEDGEVNVEATLDALTDPTPHFISRPLALLKAACIKGCATRKVKASEFLAVFPEETEDSKAAKLAASAAKKAPKVMAPKASKEHDPLALPPPVKAPSAKPKAPSAKPKAPKAVKLPDGAALVESLKTKTPHAAPVSQPDPAATLV